MAERFRPGDPVLVRAIDPPHHTRAPRYVRGRQGVVLEVHGAHRLPDDVVTGAGAPAVEPVYAVRFEAADLWGEGAHSVVVNLWQTYLAPAPRLDEAEAGRGR
ncbi:MAG: SH3-like domain-containing protein [Acidimicrobiales bacterium]